MSAGPIPWTAIVAWCAHHRLDDENTETMTTVIRQLDVARAERIQSDEELRRGLGTGVKR